MFTSFLPGSNQFILTTNLSGDLCCIIMGCRLCKNYRNFELNILKIFTYIRGYLYISVDIYYISVDIYYISVDIYYISVDIYYISVDIYYISVDIYYISVDIYYIFVDIYYISVDIY